MIPDTRILIDRTVLGWLLVDQLNRMWGQWQDDRTGCCHVCCAPCSSVYRLARTWALDGIIDMMADNGARGSDWWVTGDSTGVPQVDRDWLGVFWTNPPCIFTETHQQLMEE